VSTFPKFVELHAPIAIDLSVPLTEVSMTGAIGDAVQQLDTALESDIGIIDGISKPDAPLSTLSDKDHHVINLYTKTPVESRAGVG
jgi:hypothetical protein